MSKKTNTYLQLADSPRGRVGFLFNSDIDSDSNSLIFMKVLEVTASSYRSVIIFIQSSYYDFYFGWCKFFFFLFFSHKKKVLNFLDQLCSYYESSQESQEFLDKISELADANGIQSKGFKSAISEFSVDKFTRHLKKV